MAADKKKPKQKKGGPGRPFKPGNKLGNKFEPGRKAANKFTPAALRKAQVELCEHFRAGGGLEDFEGMSASTIRRYLEADDPNFDRDEIEAAYRAGLRNVRALVQQGAAGKIPGFNATAAIFLAKNKGLSDDPALGGLHKPKAAPPDAQGPAAVAAQITFVVVEPPEKTAAPA